MLKSACLQVLSLKLLNRFELNLLLPVHTNVFGEFNFHSYRTNEFITAKLI